MKNIRLSAIIAVFMLAIVIGSSNAASCGTPLGGELYCLPFNAVSGNTMSANTQIPLTLDAGAIKTYLAANLMNIEVYNTISGNTYNAWLEGNQLGEQQKTSLSTSNTILIWVNIPGNNWLSENDLAIAIFSTSTDKLSGAGAYGEAPQLSPTYGAADNGNVVFLNYCDFQGTTLCPTFNSGNSAAATVTVSNALVVKTVTSESPSYGYVVSNTAYANAIIDTYAGNFVMSQKGKGGVVFIPAGFVASNTMPGPVQAGTPYFANGLYGDFRSSGSQFQYDLFNLGTSENTLVSTYSTSCAPCTLNVSSTLATANLMLVKTNYTTVINFIGGNGLPQYSIAGTISSGSGAGTPSSSGFIANWTRTRIAPPNAVNPAVSFGSVTPTTSCTAGITNPTNAIADVGQKETFTVTQTGCTSTFTYNTITANSVTVGTITHNSLITGSSANSITTTFTLTSADVSNSPEVANGVITDSGSNIASTGYSTSFVINTAPTISANSISNTIAYQTQWETLIGSVAGGTSSFTYNFFVTNTANGNIISNSLITTASSSNTFVFQLPVSTNDVGSVQVKLTITDAASTPVSVSATNTITVYAVPAVNSIVITPSNSIIAGNSITANYIQSGGTGTFIFTNTLNGLNFVGTLQGTNKVSNALTLPIAGTYTYSITPTDTGLTTPYTLSAVTNTLVVSGISCASCPQIFVQNATSIIGETILNFPATLHTNPTTSVNASWNDLISGTVTLTGPLFAHDVIVTGTLTLNGFSVVAYNAFINNGVVITGQVPNTGGTSTNVGKSFLNSYAGSAGAGAGVSGANGGSTLAVGGTAPAGNGIAANALTVSNSWIQQYFLNMSNVISSAGGGGGNGPSGANGMYGGYIQANTLYPGTITANGIVGSNTGGIQCAGSSGGAVMVFAYKSVLGSTASVNVLGGPYNIVCGTGTNAGGAGGPGQIVLYQWTTQPEGLAPSANTLVGWYYPVRVYTTVQPNFVYNLSINGQPVVSTSNSFSYLLSPDKYSSAYTLQIIETNTTNNHNYPINVTFIPLNMIDISGPFTFNTMCTPTIQKFPNCVLFPSGANAFTMKPKYWRIQSDLTVNNHNNFTGGNYMLDQFSNANVTFVPKVLLNYSFTSFYANTFVNPTMTNSITQVAYTYNTANSVPAAPITRRIINITTYDQRTFNKISTNSTITLGAVFNNYTVSNSISYVYNSVISPVFAIFMPTGNYQNPSINLTSISVSSTATGHFQGFNNYCPTVVPSATYLTFRPYLVDLNGSLYTYNIYSGYSSVGIGDFLQVMSGTSSSTSSLVQQYKITANPFAQPLENGGSYAFILLNPQCNIVYATNYSVWGNPININIPLNTSVPQLHLPNVTITCNKIPLGGNAMNITCSGTDVSSQVSSWVLTLYDITLNGWTAVNSITINSSTFSHTYNGLGNTTGYRVIATASSPVLQQSFPFDFNTNGITTGFGLLARAFLTVLFLLVGLGLSSIGQSNGSINSQHIVSSTLIIEAAMFALTWMVGLSTFIPFPAVVIIIMFLGIIGIMAHRYEGGFTG